MAWYLLRVQDIRLRRTNSSLNSRMLLTLGQIARSITKTHEPPILDCTPYQILQRSEYSTAQKTSYLPCHRRSVEYTPQTSKYSEAGTVDDREGYMEYSTRSTRQNDERRHHTITNPDDQPGLPPRHAEDNHARGYHPTIRELVWGYIVSWKCATDVETLIYEWSLYKLSVFVW